MNDIRGVSAGAPTGGISGLDVSYAPRKKGMEEFFAQEALKVVSKVAVKEANKKKVSEVGTARAEVFADESAYDRINDEESAKWYAPIYTSSRLEGARQQKAVAMFTRAQKATRDSVYDSRAMSGSEYQKILQEQYEQYLTGDEEVDAMFLQSIEGDRVDVSNEQIKAHAVYSLERDAEATIDYVGAMAESITDDMPQERKDFISGKIAGHLANKLSSVENSELVPAIEDYVASSVFKGDSTVYDALMKSQSIDFGTRARLVKVKELANDIKFQKQSKEYALALGNSKADLERMMDDPNVTVADYVKEAKAIGEEFGLGQSFYGGIGGKALKKEKSNIEQDGEAPIEVLISREKREAKLEHDLRSGNLAIDEMIAAIQIEVDNGSYSKPKELVAVIRVMENAKLKMNQSASNEDLNEALGDIIEKSKIAGVDSGAMLNGLAQSMIAATPAQKVKINKAINDISESVQGISKARTIYRIEDGFNRQLEDSTVSAEELDIYLASMEEVGLFEKQEIDLYARKISDRSLSLQEREEKINDIKFEISFEADADNYKLPAHVIESDLRNYYANNSVSTSERAKLDRILIDRQRREGEITEVVSSAMNGKYSFIKGKELEDVYERVDYMQFPTVKDKARLVSNLPPDPRVVVSLGMSIITMRSGTPPSEEVVSNLELVKAIKDEKGVNFALKYFDGNEEQGLVLLNALETGSAEQAYMTAASYSEVVKKDSKVLSSSLIGMSKNQKAKARKYSVKAVDDVIDDNDLGSSEYAKMSIMAMISKAKAEILVEKPYLAGNQDMLNGLAKESVDRNNFSGVIGLTEDYGNTGSLRFGESSVKDKVIGAVSRLHPDANMREDYEIHFVDGMFVMYPLDEEGEPIIGKPFGISLDEIEREHRKSGEVAEANKQAETLKKIQDYQLEVEMSR